ncbi:MAG: hypothetical protein K0R57_4765 [Paenibacillaceae bacterium]|nr:hypothetical protein [Paenibacillaceae bacterium]
MKTSGSKQNPLKYVGFAGAIGMNLVVWIVIGYFGGGAIARRTGLEGFTAAGTLLGLFIGLASIVLMIKRILEETNE